MNKNIKIVLCILSMLLGYLLMGVGYTMKIGHPINTICMLLGMILFLLGIVFLFIKLTNS